MADKSTPLILTALSRAVADPAGLPLFGSKSSPSLFASSAGARQAAQRCKDESLLHVVRSEKRGSGAVEICAITEKGLAYLLSQVSPKRVLEELVGSLQARERQVADLVAAAQQTQASLDLVRATAEKVLRAVGSEAQPRLPVNGSTPHANGGGAGAPTSMLPVKESWLAAALDCLARWQAARPTADCALPELFRQVRQTSPELTIGEFHDGLRRLHERGQLYLHPWTGPLYELPEPALALLIGHEIAYYASRR